MPRRRIRIQGKKIREPKPPAPPVSITIWSSSHGQEWHGLPDCLRKWFFEQNRTNFRLPTFHAKSGGIICSSVVHKVRKALRRSSGAAQCHVLILGSNNLRNEWKPWEISAQFKQILEFSDGIPLAHVVVCGILPSPETESDADTTKAYRDTTRLLKDLTTRYSRCSFLDIPDFFTDNRVVKENLYSVVRWGERRGLADIHFSHEGAQLYAKVLGGHIAFLKRETWM